MIKLIYDNLEKLNTEAKVKIIKDNDFSIEASFDEENKWSICLVSNDFIVTTKKATKYYKNIFKVVHEKNIKSISLPLVVIDDFVYKVEESIIFAMNLINKYIENENIIVNIIVEKSNGSKHFSNKKLDVYISKNFNNDSHNDKILYDDSVLYHDDMDFYIGSIGKKDTREIPQKKNTAKRKKLCDFVGGMFSISSYESEDDHYEAPKEYRCFDDDFLDEKLQKELDKRIKHMSDTFSEYLIYLIKSKKLKNADVWKSAVIDKKIFSKIKNNKNYHPEKLTALCLCIGAKLNIDETKDLLSRAGYTLSPSSKTDIIFSYFIENEFYDMIELDIKLEEYGEKSIIS